MSDEKRLREKGEQASGEKGEVDPSMLFLFEEEKPTPISSSTRVFSGQADRISGTGASRPDERSPQMRGDARARHGRGGGREKSEVLIASSLSCSLSFSFFFLLGLLRFDHSLLLPVAPRARGARHARSNSPRGRRTARALRRHGARGQEGGLGRGEALHG